EIEVTAAIMRKRRDLALFATLEEEELQLGAGIVGVSQFRQFGDLIQQQATGIAREWLVIRAMYPTDDTGSGELATLPRDDRKGGEIGHQEHIGFGDAGEPGDGRTID